MTIRLGCAIALAAALLCSSCITVKNTVVQRAPAADTCHENDDTGLFSFGCLYDCSEDDCRNDAAHERLLRQVAAGSQS